MSAHRKFTDRTADNVLIYCFNKANQDNTKFRDPEWEVWGFNARQRHLVLSDFDRWFNVHDHDWMAEHDPWWAYDVDVWQDQTWVPYYCQAQDAYRYASGRPFPREEIMAAFPRGDYHASSLDWLAAAALYAGFRHIKFCGVGFLGAEAPREPFAARACLEYWLGLAEGRGVTTRVERNRCDLFRTGQLVLSDRQYGWDHSWPIYDLETETPDCAVTEIDGVPV